MSIECALSVDVGPDAVTFALTVANGGLEPVEVTFRDAGRADFAVREGAEERWRWSDGRAFAQVLETIELAPGETFEVGADWPDPDPGQYEAVGELHAEPTCRARTDFAV